MLSKLEHQLDYPFQSPELLQQALTHRSTPGATNNERLEMLGDSVLGLIITVALFKRFPAAREGDLTKMRSRLVRGETLAKLARQQGLSDYIQLGAGELKSGSHKRDSILGNTLEAVIGAIYLDSNLAQTERVVLDIFATVLEQISPNDTNKDPKTKLQEWLQRAECGLPEYYIKSQSGPDHQPMFEVVCHLPHQGDNFSAHGSSRRSAEQAAAAAALAALQSAAKTPSDA